MRSGGIAPQLTRMNGPAARAERVWMARAMTSFPEPVSPKMRTGTSEGLTSATLHHRSQPPVGADDCLCHRSAPQPSEQGLFIGFGRLPESGELTEPMVVL